MRLGVLGGTFDPVHIGHLLLGESAREQLSLDKVLFVPAGEPWRKQGRQISVAEDRLAMLRLAVGGNQAFEVSTIEVDREGPSYTIDTLEALRSERPNDELFFIVGADALDDMPTWREPERIFELATVVVAGRPVDSDSERPVGPGIRADGISAIDMPSIALSSSEVRQRLAQGRTIRYMVPEAVEQYIREHRLYR